VENRYREIFMAGDDKGVLHCRRGADVDAQLRELPCHHTPTLHRLLNVNSAAIKRPALIESLGF
jgi:hypothetical protein